MDDNENVVVETTENVVEQATEKLVDGTEVTTENVEGEQATTEEEKLYSESELNKRVDEILAKKIGNKLANQERKLRKEYEDKYSRTETVLNAGLGTNNIQEATEKLADFYKEKGIAIPEQPKYSEHDLQLLAKAEADEIIASGYEELVEEVDRLVQIGANNMTSREKLVFKKLAEERQKQESIQELAEIGVGLEILEDKDYQHFSKKLNPNMSEKDKYEMYLKYKPKQKIQPLGSMKGTTTKDSGVKEFYTFEEANKFTRADFNKNPELYKAVCNSMSKWGK